MRRSLLLILSTLLAINATYAQDVFLNLAAGLAGNRGPKGKDISSTGTGYARLAADISALADMKYLQAGLGASVFSIKNKTSFLFEEGILPDKAAKTYPTSIAAPAFSPYIFVSAKLRVSKTGSYIFGGGRTGVVLFTKEEISRTPYYGGTNNRGEVVLASANTFIYGAQLGFATHSNNRVATGFTASWQRFSTKANFTYDATYIYPFHGINQAGFVALTRSIPYTINLYSIQVFLRFKLHSNAKKITRDNTECPK